MPADYNKKLLFLTHVGNIGGAEYKMIQIASNNNFSGNKVVHFQEGELEKELKGNNISSEILPMPETMAKFTKDDGLKALLKTIPACLSMVKSLAKEAKQHDVIICMSQKSFLLASIAKPFFRKPIVWYMNDILSTTYFNKILVYLLAVLSYLTANKVILNSSASFNAWKKSRANMKNVHVIYPGTDIEKFEKELKEKATIEQIKKEYSPNGKPLIGIFGRITEWKGQDIFLQAISRIKDVNAIIVGDALFGEDEFKNKIIKLTNTLGIKDRVTFTGHLNNMPHVMSACNIVAHCSTLAEPFGLVIVEASISGAPVIATNAGGPKEIIDHDITGQLTPMADVDALTLAINRYLENPTWANELNEKSKIKIREKFSQDNMIQRASEVILSLFRT